MLHMESSEATIQNVGDTEEAPQVHVFVIEPDSTYIPESEPLHDIPHVGSSSSSSIHHSAYCDQRNKHNIEILENEDHCMLLKHSDVSNVIVIEPQPENYEQTSKTSSIQLQPHHTNPTSDSTSSTGHRSCGADGQKDRAVDTVRVASNQGKVLRQEQQSAGAKKSIMGTNVKPTRAAGRRRRQKVPVEASSLVIPASCTVTSAVSHASYPVFTSSSTASMLGSGPNMAQSTIITVKTCMSSTAPASHSTAAQQLGVNPVTQVWQMDPAALTSDVEIDQTHSGLQSLKQMYLRMLISSTGCSPAASPVAALRKTQTPETVGLLPLANESLHGKSSDVPSASKPEEMYLRMLISSTGCSPAASPVTALRKTQTLETVGLLPLANESLHGKSSDLRSASKPKEIKTTANRRLMARGRPTVPVTNCHNTIKVGCYAPKVMLKLAELSSLGKSSDVCSTSEPEEIKRTANSSLMTPCGPSVPAINCHVSLSSLGKSSVVRSTSEPEEIKTSANSSLMGPCQPTVPVTNCCVSLSSLGKSSDVCSESEPKDIRIPANSNLMALSRPTVCQVSLSSLGKSSDLCSTSEPEEIKAIANGSLMAPCRPTVPATNCHVPLSSLGKSSDVCSKSEPEEIKTTANGSLMAPCRPTERKCVTNCRISLIRLCDINNFKTKSEGDNQPYEKSENKESEESYSLSDQDAAVISCIKNRTCYVKMLRLSDSVVTKLQQDVKSSIRDITSLSERKCVKRCLKETEKYTDPKETNHSTDDARQCTFVKINESQSDSVVQQDVKSSTRDTTMLSERKCVKRRLKETAKYTDTKEANHSTDDARQCTFVKINESQPPNKRTPNTSFWNTSAFRSFLL